MAEKLKDTFLTGSTMSAFADVIKNEYKSFNKEKFIKSVFNDDWKNKELKARWRHVAVCVHDELNMPYKDAVKILMKIAPGVKGVEALALPDFVELYGIDDWDISMEALKIFTTLSSSEFAIRPFILKDPQKAMKFMDECANDKDEKIRRFASEGCRPRLPWGMNLNNFIDDPAPIIPILEKLKDDESEFVRRSVANNMNDISKDHPDVMLDLCKKWQGKSENTDWIIKHACRTLLKKGNKKAMMLFGYGDPDESKVQDFALESETIKIGDEMKFSFKLDVSGKDEVKLRLEYAIDYMKANGKHSRKVFKMTESSYAPGEYKFKRKHTFQQMTTRTHYPGIHFVAVIINGIEKIKAKFNVIE